MPKIIFKFLILLLATSTLRAESMPNIIYILADDLGYGDLSFLGQKYFKTPHIDQLAKDGFDLKSQKTKNYLEFEFNSTTDHLRSIKDFFSYLEKDYTKISFEEFMELFNGLDKLLRRWQAVGIVSAQKALELVNQEPYPKIDFFDLDQSFIDEVKEPKKWYVDVNQSVLV